MCTYVSGVCEQQCPSQAHAVRLSSPMLWRPLDPGGSEASATLRLVWPGRRRGGCSRRELSQGRCFGDVGSRVWSPLTGAVATARGVPSYVGRFSWAAVKNSTLPRSVRDRVVFPDSCQSRHGGSTADGASPSCHGPRPGFSSGDARIPETFLGSSRRLRQRAAGGHRRRRHV